MTSLKVIIITCIILPRPTVIQYKLINCRRSNGINYVSRSKPIPILRSCRRYKIRLHQRRSDWSWYRTYVWGRKSNWTSRKKTTRVSSFPPTTKAVDGRPWHRAVVYRNNGNRYNEREKLVQPKYTYIYIYFFHLYYKLSVKTITAQQLHLHIIVWHWMSIIVQKYCTNGKYSKYQIIMLLY